MYIFIPLLLAYWYHSVNGLFFLNQTTLSTNYELDILGLKVMESIVKNQVHMHKLNETIAETKRRLDLCSHSVDVMNQTMYQQDLLIRQIRQRMIEFSSPYVCFGMDRLDVQCSGHGKCIHLDHCECVKDWDGLKCELGMVQVMGNEGPDVRRYSRAVADEERIYLFGGFGDSDFNDLWVYSGSSWAKIEPHSLPVARGLHSFVSHHDKLWVFAGFAASTAKQDLWRFDVLTSSWMLISASNPPPVRYDHSTVVYNDLMWIFGGVANANDPLSDLWRLNMTSFGWEEITPNKGFPLPRWGHSAVTFEENFWIFGGHSDNADSNEVFRFSYANQSFEYPTISSVPPNPRNRHSAVIYQDSMWVYGGYDGGISYDDLWSFNIPNLTWMQYIINTTMPGRRAHAAVVYKDSMWIFGGFNEENLNDFWQFVF